MLRASAYLAARELLIVSAIPAFQRITNRGWRVLRARRTAVPG
jgi:hypothetical protein